MNTKFDESQATIEAPPLLRSPEEMIQGGGLDEETSTPCAFVTDGHKMLHEFQIGGIDWRVYVGYEADGQTLRYHFAALPPQGQRLTERVDCEGTVALSGR